MQNVQSHQYAAVATKDHINVTTRDHNETHRPDHIPRRLGYSWTAKGLRALLDLAMAAIGVLFTVFGLWAYKSDGKPADPGSEEAYVVSLAKYGPTVFPVLFAAIAGAAMKSLATWRIQKGTTAGLVEQLLGSSSISSAFTTQIKFHALNMLGLVIVLLWCLSPLGSQASLRVATVVSTPISSLSNLTALDAFSPYQYGYAAEISEAKTIVVATFTTALMSASLLQNRNQDLWGNIRLPAIERLVADGSTAWANISDPTNVTYSSLVGVPLAGLPHAGNTSFTLSSSYLNVTCDVLEDRQQSNFSNYASASAPAPGGTTDCTWMALTANNRFQVAISVACDSHLQLGNGTRDARRLVWESFVDSEVGHLTYAECELFTTYVDVNLSCVGASCLPSTVRRSPQPPRDRNWTVLDFDNGPGNDGFLVLFTEMFPYSTLSGGQEPIISYFVDPYQAISSSNDTPVYTIGKPAFELALAQLLNNELVIGIAPSAVVGNFSGSSTLLASSGVNTTTIVAPTFTTRDLVHCDRAWLTVLLVSSLILCLLALGAALVRFFTLVPDVLGTLSLAMLDNKCHNVAGNSTWSASERAAMMRETRIQLGDINPDGDVGQIALRAPADHLLVTEVRKGRLYS